MSDTVGGNNLWQVDDQATAPVEQPAVVATPDPAATPQPAETPQADNLPAAAGPVEAANPLPEANPSTETPSNIEDETLGDMPEEEAPEEMPVTEIRWTASDSIDHERGRGWYIGAVTITLSLVALLVVLAVFDIISTMTAVTTGVLTVIILVALLVVARKPARQLNYMLTDAGLTIEGKLYPFSEFRAFGVQRIGALWQLVLVPVRRFGLNVTMFIHEEQGEQIVDELGARLPMEDLKIDPVDRLVRRLKI
jgi:hypothetical protein